MSYKKDVDYQAKINEAVSVGDYKSAAQYEKSRNEKIDSENLSYQKTNNYSGWLNNTDYSDVLRSDMASGASKKKVSDTLKKRIEKASGTVGLTQYAYDDVYDEAIKYITGTNSFSYDAASPQFNNPYEDEIDRIYRMLEDIPEFDYDLYSDDLYALYKEQYNREGQRAMKDLLGELSMNTGGMASSYAVSAAGQMLDLYNQKLTDKIPQLYESAYKRYRDGVDSQRDNLSMLLELSENEYKHYLNELDRFNTERDFEYRKYLDALDEENQKQENEYLLQKLYAETEANERKWKREEEEDVLEEERQKIEDAFKKWENLGYLDKESAEILGLPQGTHTVDYDYKKAQQYKMYK